MKFFEKSMLDIINYNFLAMSDISIHMGDKIIVWNLAIITNIEKSH